MIQSVPLDFGQKGAFFSPIRLTAAMSKTPKRQLLGYSADVA
jgi:hypothetical protein